MEGLITTFMSSSYKYSPSTQIYNRGITGGDGLEEVVIHLVERVDHSGSALYL